MAPNACAAAAPIAAPASGARGAAPARRPSAPRLTSPSAAAVNVPAKRSLRRLRSPSARAGGRYGRARHVALARARRAVPSACRHRRRQQPGLKHPPVVRLTCAAGHPRKAPHKTHTVDTRMLWPKPPAASAPASRVRQAIVGAGAGAATGGCLRSGRCWAGRAAPPAPGQAPQRAAPCPPRSAAAPRPAARRARPPTAAPAAARSPQLRAPCSPLPPAHAVGVSQIVHTSRKPPQPWPGVFAATGEWVSATSPTCGELLLFTVAMVR